MNGNKLIQLLSDLDKKEWIAYRKYLLMHTTIESDNFRVFKYLQKRKEKLAELPEIEEIRKKHFRTLSSKSILNIMSKLHIWLEECLIHQSILKDERESQLRLVKLYNRRGLYNLADQKARKLTKLIDNDDRLSVDKLWVKTQMKYYQYFSDNPIKSKEDILSELANSLLEAHSAQKLIVYNELTNINRKTKKYDEILKAYNPFVSKLTNSPINKFLLVLHELIKNDSVVDFYLLKNELLSSSFEHKSDLEILICMYLFVWSFILTSQKKIENDNLTIEILNYGLINNLLNPGDQLSPTRFIDLINSISKVSSVAETKKFIKKWVSNVSSEKTESMEVIAIATCYVVKREYDKIPVQPTLYYFYNINLKLHSISIYIVSCFNQKERDYNSIYNALNILYRIIYRYKKTIPNTYFIGYTNFIKSVKLLLENKDFNPNKFSNIMHYNWVKDQIDKGKAQ